MNDQVNSKSMSKIILSICNVIYHTGVISFFLVLFFSWASLSIHHELNCANNGGFTPLGVPNVLEVKVFCPKPYQST